MISDAELLRAVCCIACLDGEIDARERRQLRTLAVRAGVGETSLDAMIEQALGDRSFLEEQFALLATDPDRAITAMFTIAIADGKLLVDERVVIRHFADKLGVPQRRFEKLLRIAERNA